LTELNDNCDKRATDINSNSSGLGTFAEALVLPADPGGGQGETSISGRGADEEVLGAASVTSVCGEVDSNGIRSASAV